MPARVIFFVGYPVEWVKPKFDKTNKKKIEKKKEKDELDDKEEEKEIKKNGKIRENILFPDGGV